MPTMLMTIQKMMMKMKKRTTMRTNVCQCRKSKDGGERGEEGEEQNQEEEEEEGRRKLEGK